jgi:hypothetical protein
LGTGIDESNYRKAAHPEPIMCRQQLVGRVKQRAERAHFRKLPLRGAMLPTTTPPFNKTLRQQPTIQNPLTTPTFNVPLLLRSKFVSSHDRFGWADRPRKWVMIAMTTISTSPESR